MSHDFLEFPNTFQVSENNQDPNSLNSSYEDLSITQTLEVQRSINPEDKENYILNLKFFISSITLEKQKTRVLMTEINSEFKKLLKFFNDQIKLLKKTIQTILKENSFSIPLNLCSTSDNSTLDLNDFNNFLKNHENCSNFESKFFLVEDYKVSLKSFQSQSEPCDDFLYFFKHNSTTLKRFDLSSKSFNKQHVKMRTESLISPCIQQISSNQLFIHGGRTSEDNYMFESMILDLGTFDLHNIPKGIPVSNSRPCLFENCVYIFGGYKFSSISNSQKFDLAKVSWELICDLPFVMHETISTPVNHYLLISGASVSKLLLYNPRENVYDLIDLHFSTGVQVVLFTFKNFVYLISDRIFKCSKLFLADWEVVRRIKPGEISSNIITSVAARGKFVYFADWKGTVYEFNCNDETFKKFSR